MSKNLRLTLAGAKGRELRGFSDTNPAASLHLKCQVFGVFLWAWVAEAAPKGATMACGLWYALKAYPDTNLYYMGDDDSEVEKLALLTKCDHGGLKPD
jgi:hypothetical protein